MLLLIVAVVFGAVIALIVARALRKEKRELKSGGVAADGGATTDKGASQRFVKRCPTCKSVYADESLAFCLSDGSTLERVPDASPSNDPDATLLYREGDANLPPTVQYQPGRPPNGPK